MTAPPSRPAGAGQVDRDNPWPGLPSFREQDQEFFFGREAETEALRRTVTRDSVHATVLFGRSGLGKTSLLQAGLFPRLRPEMLPVAVRLVWGAERGLVQQVRAAILGAAAAARVEAPSFPPGETLWESFHRAGANFWSESNRIVVPLLVFDQFEEIFTLGRRDPGREELLAELADLVEGRPPAAVKERLDAEPALAAGFTPKRHDYRILLSLRQDFFADLDSLRARMRSLGASRITLQPMNGEAALRAVNGAGERLIAPDVAEKVVRFVAGAGRQAAAGAPSASSASAAAEREGAAVPSSGEAAPPALAELEVDPTLLSLVCRELNNRRRERGEPRITFDLLSGSWKEILTRFYDDSLAGLAPEVRTFIEDRLLTRSGYRDSVAWDNAVAEPGVTAADLLTLRDRRLLRIEERHGADWIELTHDVLTEVVGESRGQRRQREALRAAEERTLEAREHERQAEEDAHQARQRERETRHLLLRSRRLAVVLGLVLLAALSTGVLAALLWHRSEAAERQAASAQRRAEHALLDSAGNLIEKGRGAQALAYLAAIMRSSSEDSGTARGRALDLLLHESWPLPVRVVRQDRAVTNAQLSPDGERLLTVSLDGTARLWRVRDGASLGVMGSADRVIAAAFSPDGNRVLTGSRDGTVRIWDGHRGTAIGPAIDTASPVSFVEWSPRGDRFLAGGLLSSLWDPATRRRLTPPLQGPLSFSPDGARLLLARYLETPLLIDPRTGSSAGGLPWLGEDISQMAFNHRGDRLLTVDGTSVRIWDLAAHRQVSSHQHKVPVTWAEFSPDDQTLLTVCVDRIVRLWNLDTPAPPTQNLQHDRIVNAAHFSPDGRLVLTGSQDGAARLWDARTGELAMQPFLHGASVTAAGFSRDSRQVVTAADDGTAKVWDARADRYARPRQFPRPVRFGIFDTRGGVVVGLPPSLGRGEPDVQLWELATGTSRGIARGSGHLSSIDLLGDGRLAVTTLTSEPATLQVWDGSTGNRLSAPIQSPDASSLLVRVSADGQRVVAWGLLYSSAGKGEVEATIWDARSGTKIAAVRCRERVPHVSDDGSLLLTSSESGVQLWETKTGRKIGEIKQSHTLWAGLSPKGRLIATVADDSLLRLFEPGGQRIGSSLRIDQSPGNTLGFSQDSTRLIAARGGGEFEVVEVATSRVLCRVQTSSPPVTDPLAAEAPFLAELSSDGKRILTRSAEGFAQIWDVDSCQPLSEPLWHPPPKSWVTSAQLSPDGDRVLTVDSDETARVWDLPATSPADGAALADLAEAVGGFAVDDAGNAVPVEHQVERLARLRERSARGEGEPRVALQLMRWFFAPPEKLTISPFSTIKIAAAPSPAR